MNQEGPTLACPEHLRNRTVYQCVPEAKRWPRTEPDTLAVAGILMGLGHSPHYSARKRKPHRSLWETILVPLYLPLGMLLPFIPPLTQHLLHPFHPGDPETRNGKEGQRPSRKLPINQDMVKKKFCDTSLESILPPGEIKVEQQVIVYICNCFHSFTMSGNQHHEMYPCKSSLDANPCWW